MALIYTTSAAILRRLQGRVASIDSVFGQSTLSDDLLQQIGGQVEDRITNELRKVYKLPLTGSHPRLAEIAELGIICQLLPTHVIQGESQPKDNFQAFTCSQYSKLLEAIINGDSPLEGEQIISPIQSDSPQTFFKVARYNPLPSADIKW